MVAEDKEISYEISPRMGLVLASCFEMVGLSTPGHISSDKMALVVDRIDKTRRQLKRKLMFDNDSGKIREYGGKKKFKVEQMDNIINSIIDHTEASAPLKAVSNVEEKEEVKKPAKTAIQEEIEANPLKFIPEEYMYNSVEKTALVVSNLGIMRSQMKLLLKQKGYKVFCVNNIKEMPSVLKNNAFNLIVAEVKELKDLLPVAQARLLIEDECKLMVISSELKNIEIKMSCEQIGVDIYVEKQANWQSSMLYNLGHFSNSELKYA